MKKVVNWILVIFMVLPVFLTACNNGSNEEDVNIHQESIQEENDSNKQNVKSNDDTADSNNEAKKIEDTKIKLTFNNEEVIVKMLDNPTSNDFLSQLPLTLTFEDHAGTEKISYIPSELSTEGAPSGIEPVAGDFTYYAPWGNLALFYEDFRFSNGLIKLGEFESGIEKLEHLDGDFEMVIKKIE
ncbi:cyclophilin-like fold protein [Psychrobacillus sp. NPDC093180]|uniref:cyclophilin-like fold protein n=1 Tax=Psychrobacillus sp. NPDC093180 TaxID=3364489 RepID=UPI0037F2C294